MADIIVITWAEMDGSEPTGLTEMRDGCHRPTFRTIKKARAVVWSRRMADLPLAKKYASDNGYRVRILPNTPDVLTTARSMELRQEN